MNKMGEKIGFIAFFFTAINISSSPHPFLLVLCYVIHEAGHLLMARLNRVDMRALKIGSFRLCLSYDCSRVSYKKELLVCLGGIVFNLIAAVLAALLGDLGNEYINFFAVCNLSLAIMNIYPVSTLDGGGALKCALMLALKEETAQKAIKTISFSFALILWLCAVYLQLVFDANISLLFISVFLLVQICFS